MSEFTTEQILEMIEEHRGPHGLDLRGKDLSGIDLRRETIQALREARCGSPRWVSEITGGIDLQGAHLEGAYLMGAHLEGGDLAEGHLEGAYLVGAHLGAASLVRARLEGANLIEAHLERAELNLARLERADLREARLEGADFCDVYLEHTQMTRESFGSGIGEELIGAYQSATEAYCCLKQNFASLGRYEDAAWAYVKERQMERKAALHPESGDSQRPGIWLRNTVWRCLCNYGESIWLPVAWMAGLGLILFPFLYWLVEGVQVATATVSYTIPRWPPYWDWFYLGVFSIRSLATMTGGGLEPANFVGLILSSVEAMVGVFFFAVIVYCLGRRMSGR